MVGASLAVISSLLYCSSFSLIIFFGIHHALNESYLRRDSDEHGNLAPARSFLHFFAFMVILRGNNDYRSLPSEVLWSLFALSALYYFCLVVKSSGVSGIVRQSAIEWFSLAAVVASIFVTITFLQLVLYHFVLWSLLPVKALYARGKQALLQYSILTIAITGLFLIISPIGIGAYYLNNNPFITQFYFWSYMHITCSFALSDSHPQWVRQVFQTNH